DLGDLDAAFVETSDEVSDLVSVVCEVETFQVFGEALASNLGVAVEIDELLDGNGSDLHGVDQLGDGFVPEVGVIGDSVLQVVEAGGDLGVGLLGGALQVGEGGGDRLRGLGGFLGGLRHQGRQGRQ